MLEDMGTVCGHEKLKDKALVKFAAKNEHLASLTDLDLAMSENLQGKGVVAVLSACPNITTINLRYCTGLDASLVFPALATSAKSLTSLQLGDADVPVECLPHLQNLPLEFLSLRSNDRLSSGLDVLANLHPTLTSLDLGFVPIPKAEFQAIAAACTKLVNLDVYRCQNLDDESLGVIATSCPGLTELDFGNNENYTPAGLSSLAEHLTHLQKVVLNDTEMNQDEPFIAFISANPDLAHLDIRNVNGLTEAFGQALLDHCPKLEYFNVSYCTGGIQGFAINTMNEAKPDLEVVQ